MSSHLGQSARGERLPHNHQTILTAIRAAAPGEHLTAHEIFTRARRVQPKIGFATVHRGLARLHELGFVLKLDVPGAAGAVYEPAASPHAHFRCLGCGQIRDVAFQVPADQLARLASQLGISIDAESTTFAGRCAACLAAG